MNRHRPVRLIQGMPIIYGHVSLTADVIKESPRAKLVSNGTTELWLPNSQIVRVAAPHVIITAWIAGQKYRAITLLKNKSPQYAEWLAKSKERSEFVRQWSQGSGGFQCKFGDGDE